MDTAQRKGELIEITELQEVVNEGTAIFAGMTDPTAILKLLNSENDKILAATADKLHALSKKGEA